MRNGNGMVRAVLFFGHCWDAVCTVFAIVFLCGHFEEKVFPNNVFERCNHSLEKNSCLMIRGVFKKCNHALHVLTSMLSKLVYFVGKVKKNIFKAKLMASLLLTDMRGPARMINQV